MQADAVFLNPKANAGAGARRFQAARETGLGKELGLDRVEAFTGSDAKAWLRQKLRDGARRFVIAGGDGTVNLVLGSYLALRADEKGTPKDAVFGAIGVGSSNDFHKPFESKGRIRLASCPGRVDFKKAFAHDVGVLDAKSKGESRYFFVNASMGVTAEANDRFNQSGAALSALKRVWVDGAIVTAALTTFARYQNRKVRVKLDGQAARELVLTNLGVIKSRHFSGSFRYDKGTAADDGWLGVRICRDMNRLEMLAALNALSKGKFSGRPKTESAQVRQLEVQSADSSLLAVELDGEVVRTNCARFSVRSKEVLLCP